MMKTKSQETSRYTNLKKNYITKKTQYDLDLLDDASPNKLMPPYSIYIGKGTVLEIKEHRKTFYLCFSRTIEDVKNRFNIPVEQIAILKKSVHAVALYYKDCA